MTGTLTPEDLAQLAFLTELASSAHSCPMGPVYMRIVHPDGEDYTVFDDEATLDAAISQGHVDPTWPGELVYLHPDADGDRARAIAWRYTVRGLDVPDHVKSAMAGGSRS